MQYFQCWCYSYPTSTCLTANTLTSARATSVLTHLIKKTLNYPKHCANNWDAIEDFIYDVVLPKKIVLQNWDSIKEKLPQDTIILKRILDKINSKYSTVLYE